jgi:hypothetical protein
MFRNSRIECVGRERIAAAEQLEALHGDDQMQEAEP